MVRHDYLKSTDTNDNIFIIDARVDMKNNKIFCGYLDIESLSADKKISKVISESLVEYEIDTDFSDGGLVYPCNQFNVTLNIMSSTS